MRYIGIEQAILQESDNEFSIEDTASLGEKCKLLEVGFEYVTDMEDKKLFMKRKLKPHLTRKNNI